MIERRGTAQRLLRKVVARSSQRLLTKNDPVQPSAFQPEPEVARLVGVLRRDSGLGGHGLEALQVGHDLAHVGKIARTKG